MTAAPARPARATAVLALPVAAVLALGVTVAAELAGPSGEGVVVAPEQPWLYVLCGLVNAVMAVAAAWRGTAPRLTVALSALAVLYVVAGPVHALVRAGEIATPVLWLAKLLSFPLVMLSVMLMAFAPDGRLLRGAWGRLQIAAVLLLLPGTLLILPLRVPLSLSVDPAEVAPDVPSLAATEVAGLASVVEPWVPMLLVLDYLCALVIAASVVRRFRLSQGAERDQMRWLAWGVAMLFFIIAGFRLLIDRGQLDTLGIVVSVIGIAIAVGLSVLSPTIVSIDELLSGTLVFGGLSLAIICVDLVVLAGLSELVGDRLGQRQVVLVVLLISAVLYNPLRVALWGVVRRRLMGQRDDPYDAVSRLASTLEAADDEAAQLTAVAQAVAVAFGVSFVRVEVVREGSEPVVATYGRPVAETRTLPIAYRGEEVGRLVLPARGVRARLSGRDQRLLGDLVRQAATAARTGRLADQLQENRQRLVVAREEERRRIHHDLHEDLGPTLGGLVHQVETARMLVQERPEEAKETIARTSARLRDVVADVRRVVHDLRPPALDDLGLLGALRQQATLLGPGRLSVVERGPGLERLPAGVEVAAFRIATELLRHAASEESDCEMVLSLAESWMSVECGLDTVPAEVAEALRRQATEIGGVCQVSPAGRVSVLLPVRRTA